MNGVYRDLTKTLHSRLTISRQAFIPPRYIELAHTSFKKYRRQSLERKVRKRTHQLEKVEIEAMRELNRYAEFGRISSCLIHELVNPLTAMALQVNDVIQPELASDLKEAISAMEDYIAHARRQLRHHSELQSFNVATEVIATAKLLKPKAHSVQANIIVNVAPQLMTIGDAVRFDQVIANLVANAIDAVALRSNVTKRTVRIDARKNRTHIVISVRDNGPGIPGDYLNQIFAPFFTTKPINRGTGLGLTICKQSIEDDFNGVIEVANCFPYGAEFIVRIPNT